MSVYKSYVVLMRLFSRGKYTLIALISMFAFFLLNGLMLNISNFVSFYNALGFFRAVGTMFVLSLEFFNRVETVYFTGVVLMSFFVGVFISLLFYRASILKNPVSDKSGFFGSIGIILGAAVPGCIACGVGFLSAVGLGSALAVLPFKGLEVLVLANLIVIFSIYRITQKLYNPVCKLN